MTFIGYGYLVRLFDKLTGITLYPITYLLFYLKEI